MLLAKIVFIVWEGSVIALRWAVKSGCFQTLFAHAVWDLFDISPSWDEFSKSGAGEKTSYMSLIVTNFARGARSVNLLVSVLCLV